MIKCESESINSQEGPSLVNLQYSNSSKKILGEPAPPYSVSVASISSITSLPSTPKNELELQVLTRQDCSAQCLRPGSFFQLPMEQPARQEPGGDGGETDLTCRERQGEGLGK